MTLYTRTLDGASVDAEQYDGSSDSVFAIMDLIGDHGVNNTESGLMIDGRIIPRGVWIVKDRRDWITMPLSIFRTRYTRPVSHDQY